MPRWTAHVTLLLIGPAIGSLDKSEITGELRGQGFNQVVVTLKEERDGFRTVIFDFTLEAELENTASRSAGNAAFSVVSKYLQVSVMDAEVEVKPVPIHDTRPVEDIDL